MRKKMRRTISGLLSLIMVMSLLVVAPSITAHAEEYDTFTLYYYYEGTAALYMDIWNHAGVEFGEDATTSDAFGWGKNEGSLTAVDGNENWYSIDIKILDNTANDGFDIYAGDSDTKIASYDDQWNSTEDYATLVSKAKKAYAIKDSTVYTDLTQAGITFVTASDMFTLYYYYEGTAALYMDIWNHAGVEFGEDATTSDAFGWGKNEGSLTAVDGNENWYSIDIKILDNTANDGFDIYAGDSDTKIASYDDQWNATEDYAKLVSKEKSEYAIYDGTIYTSISAAKAAIEDSTVVKDAEITVDKVKDLSDDFMLGTDISAIHSIYASGASCKDYDGNQLSEAEFFSFLKDNGVNWVRIRVWNDPYSTTEKDENGKAYGYGGGNNDLDAAIAMGKLATKAGQKVLIDFHYSDFWADPGKQKAPKAWEGKTVEEKATAIAAFTKESIQKLLDEGVDVGMVQVGNETNGALCGVTGSGDWTTDLDVLFDAGCDAVHEVAEKNNKEILAAVHFTNPEKSGRQAGYAKNLAAYDEDGDGIAEGVSYDVFASSYYPYWHGSLSNLKSVLSNIAKTFNKKVIVAETSYAWTLEDGDGHENTVRNGNNDSGDDLIYPFNINGQAKWVRDVVDTVNSIDDGVGVFYWEAAWIPVQKYVATSDDAYTVLESNEEKWEEFGSGWASSYAKEYDPDDAGVWYGGSAIDNQAFFDFDGKAIDSLKVYTYLKTGAVAEKVNVDYVNDLNVELEISDSIEKDLSEAMPDKVKLYLTDASSKDVKVTWNQENLAAATKIGEYEIEGTYEFNGEKEKVICNLSITPENYFRINNIKYSFESGDADGWELEGIGYNVTKDDPYEGSYGLHYYNASKGTFTAKQVITLKPGVYTLTVYAQGMSGDNGTLFAQVRSEDKQTESFTLAGWADSKTSANWQKPVVEDINVKATSEFSFGVTMDYQAGGWGTIDKFYLYKTDDISAVDEAAEIDALIDAIGEVSVDKEKAIDTANTAFDGASEEAKELVSKADVLEAANDKLQKLKSDIADVEERIDAIDKEITLESNDKITAAREAYDALPAESKKEVDEEKYAALEAAEKKYNELKAADDKLTKDASDVDSLITAIGVITSLDQKSAVDAARKAYDELLADAKAKVKNEAVLKAAETEIAKLEKAEQAKAAAAADADMYINAIGTVTTLNSMATVEYARKVYDALTDEQKALVKNYDKLVAAEKAIEEFVFEATPAAQDEKITEVTTNAQYKVTKVPEYDGAVGTVTYTAPADNTAETVTIPATITYHGVKYKVTAIADNTFKGNKKIQSVTIGANISKIGKKAFYNCKNLKKITIKTSKLTTSKVGANAFKNIKKTATIKVPAKKLKAYKKLLKKKGVTSKAKIKK